MRPLTSFLGGLLFGYYAVQGNPAVAIVGLVMMLYAIHFWPGAKQ